MPRTKQVKAINEGTVLLGREQEFQLIETLLISALKSSGDGRPPLSMYINGVPGTGKTATTRAVIEKLKRQKKSGSFASVFVDCFEVSCATTKGLHMRVLDQLGLKSGAPSRLVNQLERTFMNSKRPILILLDEIDNLPAMLLYKVFEWPVISKGKVVLIGIANSLGLTERLLPKLKAILPPQVITFAPYSREQLNNILHQKFSQENIDSKAFDLCARKVLAITGDVRKAIDITKQMLNSMREGTFDEMDSENIHPAPLKKAASASPARISKPTCPSSIYYTPKKPLKRPATDDDGNRTPKSACREVLRLVKKVSDSPLQRSQLPLHPRILLATFMHLISHPNQKPGKKHFTSTRAILYSAYFKVCDQLSFQPLCDDELESVYNILESQSMISLKQKGGLVIFEVEFELAREVINDDALLKSIESVSLP